MFRKLRGVLPQLIGRTITRISVRRHEHDRSQLFLFFADGTYYEFYVVGTICGTRCLDRGDIEALGPAGFIPVKGMLEIVDRETAIIVERPPG